MSQWCIILIKKSNLLSKRNNEINIQKRNIGNKNIIVNTQNLKRSKKNKQKTNAIIAEIKMRKWKKSPQNIEQTIK